MRKVKFPVRIVVPLCLIGMARAIYYAVHAAGFTQAIYIFSAVVFGVAIYFATTRAR